MKLACFSLLLLAPLACAHAATAPVCTSAREYITTLEYLRDAKQLNVAEPDARALAAKVTQGCSGAAGRFIKVSRTLLQAGLGGRDAAAEGLRLASRTDAEADAFVYVFQRAFLKEYLDLDLQAALRMARELTHDFEADILGVRNDFEKLLEFCVSGHKLDLPRPECGRFAARVAKRGQGYSGGISDAYLRLFDFLTSDKGPDVDTGKALAFAEEVATVGPGSAENFIQGYRYAVSASGLNLSNADAIKFARDLALNSMAKPGGFQIKTE